METIDYTHWTESAAIADAEAVLSPEAAQRLTEDHREQARMMKPQQARWLVSNFYMNQKARIRCAHQLRQASLTGAREFAGWLENQSIEGADLWASLNLQDELETPFLRVCDGRVAASDEISLAIKDHFAPIEGFELDQPPDPSTGSPSELVGWMGGNYRAIEARLKTMLGLYAAASPLGAWAMEQVGVGPVISAGLLAHIDLERAPTAGAVWAFAGLDPTREWQKGEKRPHNGALKRLTFLMGICFKYVSKKPAAYYGELVAERKVYETRKNERGDYEEQAMETMQGDRRPGKTTAAYKMLVQGKLPLARIQRRCERYSTKLFLSHYHTVGYLKVLRRVPVAPYAPVYLPDHVHCLLPPGFERHSTDVAGWKTFLEEQLAA